MSQSAVDLQYNTVLQELESSSQLSNTERTKSLTLLQLQKELNTVTRYKKATQQNLPDALPIFLKLVHRMSSLHKKIRKLRILEDFWKLSKEVIEGKKSVTHVQCTVKDTIEHFRNTYEKNIVNLDIEPSGRSILDNPISAPVSITEIQDSVCKINIDSAPSSDGILYKNIQDTPEVLPLLETLYTTALQSGTPASSNTAWCEPTIHLIYKKGAPTRPENYRPIAVTSAIACLFHRILANV